MLKKIKKLSLIIIIIVIMKREINKKLEKMKNLMIPTAQLLIIKMGLINVALIK